MSTTDNIEHKHAVLEKHIKACNGDGVVKIHFVSQSQAGVEVFFKFDGEAKSLFIDWWTLIFNSK